MATQTTTIDDTSPFIVYSSGGEWATDATLNTVMNASSATEAREPYYNHTYHNTPHDGDTATISFNGDGITAYGSMKQAHGYFQCILDGNYTLTQQGYSTVDVIPAEMCSFYDLTSGPHQLVLHNVPSLNASWQDPGFIGLTMAVDYLDISGIPIDADAYTASIAAETSGTATSESLASSTPSATTTSSSSPLPFSVPSPASHSSSTSTLPETLPVPPFSQIINPSTSNTSTSSRATLSSSQSTSSALTMTTSLQQSGISDLTTSGIPKIQQQSMPNLVLTSSSTPKSLESRALQVYMLLTIIMMYLPN
ncbi:hypothetical protein BCR39DRAFT_555928 [Naematelia encephala]|uniref:Uncharacterized protein n=1 Tax=Naematelia encephala TaxID=71784 RepID=A0A1Y2BLZ2_9TREE|nr:hypothetical protein BCR39DRAFT_555928 [Naematelia encephala]